MHDIKQRVSSPWLTRTVPGPSRRSLYRKSKRLLLRLLARTACTARIGLGNAVEPVVRGFLRTRPRSYLLRLDDDVTCKTCGKKFEIPSQHSLLFVDQLDGLPNEEELEREISEASGEPEPEPEEERKPALPARFTRKSSGWK